MGTAEQGGFRSPEEAAAAAKFDKLPEGAAIAGVQKNPDGTLDYSKAAVMEPSVGNFFGSEKAGRVKEVANVLSRQENPLSGHMLDEMIQFALSQPEADRNETSTHLMSRFNFDGDSGEELSGESKQEALRTAMGYFDDLQEMRDTLLAKQEELQ